VDEEDLLEIDFICCGPLVPNPIYKLVVTAWIALSNLGKLLKRDKLHSGWFTPSFFKIKLFWVDEEDLLAIEFIFCGPLVPNPIDKLVTTVWKSQTS
jgi:hypothetical protein